MYCASCHDRYMQRKETLIGLDEWNRCLKEVMLEAGLTK